MSLWHRVVDLVRPAPPPPEDPRVAGLVRRARDAQAEGREAAARTLFREALDAQPGDLAALRGLRDLAIAAGAWDEALGLQNRIVARVPAGERAVETTTQAALHYELGRAAAPRSAAAAIAHYRGALRADRRFLPATLGLGDALEATGDRREAVRVWERALEFEPALPLLARLERAYRQEGRPSRMIALYRDAVSRAPDNLAIAVALGRVYVELEMVDEAADHLEKVEVHVPDSAAVHAYLGAVFERRGELREACAEYRRALRLAHAFEWPHACSACGAAGFAWQDRCPTCRRWNTFRATDGR
jgi:lipopolysaccharide biosynthesis regulator YciM